MVVNVPNEGTKHSEVARVVADLVLRCFEQEGGVRELRVTRGAAEGFTTDVAEADVPVAINA